MDIHVYFHSDPSKRLDRMEELLNKLRKGNHNLMSKVTEFAAKEQADIDALNEKLDSIAAGIANLDTLITTLQGTVTGLSPEEQSALDAVSAARDKLVAKAAAIDTTAPVPPPVA